MAEYLSGDLTGKLLEDGRQLIVFLAGSSQWHHTILALKIASVFISIALAFAVVFLFLAIRKNISKSLEMIEDSLDEPERPKKVIVKNWESILKKMEQENETAWESAIIEADKMVDDLLKKIGYKGESMADRLKQVTPTQIVNVGGLWEAHKIRNRIVHDPGFRLTYTQAKDILKAYERTLEDLQAI